MMNLSLLLSRFELNVWYPLLFAMYKLAYRQDMHRVLFADAYATDLTDNMVPVYAALERKGGLKLVKCFPQNAGLAGNSLAGKLKGRANRSASFTRFLKEYARAGTVFLTESYLPAYAVKPRPGTRVVQLWHGSGAFKKWGYSTLDKSFGANDDRFPMHNCYTLVPVSSPEVIPHYADAFRCDPSIIRPLGIPRTDELFAPSNAKADFLAAHPELQGKTLVLYAPTFRGKTVVDAGSVAIPVIDDPDIALLIRLHPFLRHKATDCKGKYLDMSGYDTNDCLQIADILVTDYSSIIFEYALLDKPMVFYAPDLDEYIKERDFYYPYKSFVPGPLIRTESSLAAALKGPFDLSKVSSFRQTYMSACDGHSTERIINELFK